MDHYSLTTYYRGLITPIKIHRSEFVKAVCIAALKKHKDLTPKLTDSTAQIVGVISLTKIRLLRKEVKLRGLVDSGATLWLVDQPEWDSYVAALNAVERPTRHGRSVPYQYPASLSPSQLLDFVVTYCLSKGLKPNPSFQLDPRLEAALMNPRRPSAAPFASAAASSVPHIPIAQAYLDAASSIDPTMLVASDGPSHLRSPSSTRGDDDLESHVPDDLALNETWADHFSHSSQSSSQRSIDQQKSDEENEANRDDCLSDENDGEVASINQNTRMDQMTLLEEVLSVDKSSALENEGISEHFPFDSVVALGNQDEDLIDSELDCIENSVIGRQISKETTSTLSASSDYVHVESQDSKILHDEKYDTHDLVHAVIEELVDSIAENVCDPGTDHKAVVEVVDERPVEESGAAPDQVNHTMPSINLVDSSEAFFTDGTERLDSPTSASVDILNRNEDDRVNESSSDEIHYGARPNEARVEEKSKFIDELCDNDDDHPRDIDIETAAPTPGAPKANIDEALSNMESELKQLKKHIMKRKDTPRRKPQQSKIVKFGKKLLRTVRRFAAIPSSTPVDDISFTSHIGTSAEEPIAADIPIPVSPGSRDPSQRVSERISIHLTGLSMDEEDVNHGPSLDDPSECLERFNREDDFNIEPESNEISKDGTICEDVADQIADTVTIPNISNNVVDYDSTIDRGRIVDKTTLALTDSKSDIEDRVECLSICGDIEASDSASLFNKSDEQSTVKFPAPVMFYAPFLWASEISRLRLVLKSIDRTNEKNGSLVQQVLREISIFEAALLGTQFYAPGSVAYEFLSGKVEGSISQRSMDRFVSGRHRDDVTCDQERLEYLAVMWAAFQLYGRTDACVNSIIVEAIHINQVVKLLEHLDSGLSGPRGGRGKFNFDWLVRRVRVLAGEKPSEFELLVQDFASITTQRGTVIPRELLLAREYTIKNVQQKVVLKKDPWTSLSFVRFVQLFDSLYRSESFGREVRLLESAAEAFHCTIRGQNGCMLGVDRGSFLSNASDIKANALIECTLDPGRVMASVVRAVQTVLGSSDMEKVYYPSQNFPPRYELSSSDGSNCEESTTLQHLRGGIFDDPEVTFSQSVFSVPFLNGASEPILPGIVPPGHPSNPLFCEGDLAQWRQIYARFASQLPSDTLSAIKSKCLGRAGVSAIRNPFMSFEDCKICFQALNLYPSSADQITLVRLFRAVKRWEWNLAFYYSSGAVIREVAGVSPDSPRESVATVQSWDEPFHSDHDKSSTSRVGSNSVKGQPSHPKGVAHKISSSRAGAPAARRLQTDSLPVALRQLVKNHVIVHDAIDRSDTSVPVRDQQLLHDCLVTLPTFTISFWGFIELIVRLSILIFERSLSSPSLPLAPGEDEQPLPCGIVLDRAAVRSCVHSLLRLIDVRGGKHALLHNKKYSLSLSKFTCK